MVLLIDTQEDNLREIYIDSNDSLEEDRTLLGAQDWKTELLAQLFRGTAVGTGASSTAIHETGNRHVTGSLKKLHSEAFIRGLSGLDKLGGGHSTAFACCQQIPHKQGYATTTTIADGDHRTTIADGDHRTTSNLPTITTLETFLVRSSEKEDIAGGSAGQRLFTLRHASRCSGYTEDEGGSNDMVESCCQFPRCGEMRKLWRHMLQCTDTRCSYPLCTIASWEIRHFRACNSSDCTLCAPVRKDIQKASSEDTPMSTTQCNVDETPDGTFDVCEQDALTSRLMGMSVLEAQAPETLRPISPAGREIPARYSIARSRGGRGTGRTSSSITRNQSRNEGPFAFASACGSDSDTAIGTQSSLVVEQIVRGMQDSTAFHEGCDRRSLSCRKVPAGCRDEEPGAPQRHSNFEQARSLICETSKFPVDFEQARSLTSQTDRCHVGDVDPVGEVESCLDMCNTEIRREGQTYNMDDDDDDDQALLCQKHTSGARGVASEYFDLAEEDANNAYMEGGTDAAGFRANRPRVGKRRHAAKGSPRDGRYMNRQPPVKSASHIRIVPSRATKLARSLLKRVWKRVSPADRRSGDGLSLCKAVILQSGDDECNNVLHERSSKPSRGAIDVSATTMAPFGDMGGNNTSGSFPWCAVVTTECARNNGPPISDSAGEHLTYRMPPDGRSSMLQNGDNALRAPCSATDVVLNQQQYLLLLLRHAVETCSAADGSNRGCTCAMPSHCSTVRKLWDHVAVCVDAKCPSHLCRNTSIVLRHFFHCEASTRCDLCGPVWKCHEAETCAAGSPDQ